VRTFLHFCKAVAGLDGPESQVTPDELRLLLEYSRGAKVAVELGCFEGKTAVALARNSVGTVYSIDPFSRGRLGVAYGELITRLHRRRQRARNLVLVKGFSYRVVEGFEREVDFLFIDADHNLDAVRRDWEDWVPKLRKRAYVALHDCRPAANSPAFLGSMQFYRDELSRRDDVEQVAAADSLVIFRVVQ
jgi:predicted O-methyltransferase YrrM